MSRMSVRAGVRAWLRGARPGDATWRSSPCMCARPALGHLFASPTLPLPGASRWVGSAGGTCRCKESEAANENTPGGEHRPLQPDTDDLQWEQELLETFNAKAPIAQSLGLRSTIPQPNPALDLGSCAAGALPPAPVCVLSIVTYMHRAPWNVNMKASCSREHGYERLWKRAPGTRPDNSARPLCQRFSQQPL
jgi:hypothetical protein